MPTISKSARPRLEPTPARILSPSIERCLTSTCVNLSGALACALCLVACGAPPAASSPTASPSAASQRARASDFALRDIDGRTVRLSDYLGQKVILLNFWATWCGPCAGELPHLQEIYEAHKSQGFMALAISMDGPESIAEV